MASETQPIKEHRLNRDQELRFEVGAHEVIVEVVDGTAELFGIPLKRRKRYPFPPGSQKATSTAREA